MQRLLLSLAVVAYVVTSGPAFAQDAHDPALARRAALIRQYLEAIEFEKLMDASSTSMIAAQTEHLPDSAALSSEDRQIIAEVAEQVLEETRGLIVDRFVALYAELFTEPELRALVEFYESDVGQSITAKSQIVAVQSGPIMAEILPEIAETMRTRLCARIKCPAASAQSKQG